MEKIEGRFGRSVREVLEKAGVLWIYEGCPRKEAPHALLTSGNHSDGFANVGVVLRERPEVRRMFAEYIVEAVRESGGGKFNRVVGAATSSTDLAEEVARISAVKLIVMVKTEEGGAKRQVWHTDNLALREGEVILHLEDLITTSSSALQVREEIRRANSGVPVYFLPILPTIIERSDPDNRVIRVENSVILPLLRLDIRNFPADGSCPYCAVGSEALPPKYENNWSKLTGKV